MFKKKLITGLALAMMMSAATGCGSSKNNSAKYLNSDFAGSYPTESTTTAASYEEYAYEDAETAYDTPGDVGINNNQSIKGETASGDDTTNTLSQIDTEKLVYRCDVLFDTEDYNASINELKNLMNQYGAFLEYENEWNSEGRGNNPSLHNYNATIRIPVANYQAFLDGMGNLGDLKNKCQNVENLSQEYSDLSAELEVLETKRDSYISMMKEAKTLNDMESLLMIDERLTDVEVSINRIKTRLNNINNDVSFSYITITINEVREYEAPVAETFSQRVSQAFKDGWKDFNEGCQDFVIWAAEHIIGLGIFLVIILTIWFALLRKPVKALRARFKALKATKKAVKAAYKVSSDNTQVPEESSSILDNETSSEAVSESEGDQNNNV